MCNPRFSAGNHRDGQEAFSKKKLAKQRKQESQKSFMGAGKKFITVLIPFAGLTRKFRLAHNNFKKGKT